jgi:hypothetical protein
VAGAAVFAAVTPAWGGERAPVGVAVGVGIGVMADLSDAASRPAGAPEADTRWGPGIAVSVPVRVALHELVRLRIDPRLEVASGVDQLTWDAGVFGVDARAQDDGAHEAWLGLAGVDLGAEVVVPVAGAVRPTLHAALGMWGVGAFHALRGESLALLDPAQNVVGDARNRDPYTVQFVPGGTVGAGVLASVGAGVQIGAELSYGGGFVAPAALRKAPEGLDGRREAFAVNPIRATLSVLFSGAPRR